MISQETRLKMRTSRFRYLAANPNALNWTPESVAQAWRTRREKYGLNGLKTSTDLPPLSEKDLLWLSCVVDTEGSIRRGKYRTLIVTVEMTSQSFMEKYAALVQEKISIRDYNPSKNPKWSRSFRVAVGGKKAEQFFALIKPYLLTEKKDIE